MWFSHRYNSYRLNSRAVEFRHLTLLLELSSHSNSMAICCISCSLRFGAAWKYPQCPCMCYLCHRIHRTCLIWPSNPIDCHTQLVDKCHLRIYWNCRDCRPYHLSPCRWAKNNCSIWRRDSTIYIHRAAIDHILVPISHSDSILECRNCCCSCRRIALHENRECRVDNPVYCTIDTWYVYQYNICHHSMVLVNYIHVTMIAHLLRKFECIDHICSNDKYIYLHLRKADKFILIV